nr:hypothetical protein [Kibdelosporangium sp. MJ126-NF4]
MNYTPADPAIDRLVTQERAVDPVPDDLAAMVDFALDHESPDAEFLRPVSRHRNDRSRMLTFEGAGKTVLIAITEDADVTVRVDGWVAPAAACRVRLRTAAGVLEVSASATGRFTYASVHRGLAQISLCRNRSVCSVATPTLVL